MQPYSIRIHEQDLIREGVMTTKQSVDVSTIDEDPLLIPSSFQPRRSLIVRRGKICIGFVPSETTPVDRLVSGTFSFEGAE